MPSVDRCSSQSRYCTQLCTMSGISRGGWYDAITSSSAVPNSFRAVLLSFGPPDSHDIQFLLLFSDDCARTAAAAFSRIMFASCCVTSLGSVSWSRVKCSLCSAATEPTNTSLRQNFFDTMGRKKEKANLTHAVGYTR